MNKKVNAMRMRKLVSAYHQSGESLRQFSSSWPKNLYHA